MIIFLFIELVTIFIKNIFVENKLNDLYHILYKIKLKEFSVKFFLAQLSSEKVLFDKSFNSFSKLLHRK